MGGRNTLTEADKCLAPGQVSMNAFLPNRIRQPPGIGNNHNAGENMGVHRVNMSQKAQTSQLSSCNQMPITKWGPAGSQAGPLTPGLYETPRQGTLHRTRHSRPPALMNPVLRSGGGPGWQPEDPGAPPEAIRQLGFQHAPAGISPEAVTSALLSLPGPVP